ncbi:hypothetical protein TorRG33x02_356840 [Trema orientale]|uniref:Uncharacterized protein n=1 Tax=Trema orientale TaxID=63057 RepID=A0A2P5A6H1_TREOI|nr:hypothetical protein TorRG33x02_356840 [Trema orientale]
MEQLRPEDFQSYVINPNAILHLHLFLYLFWFLNDLYVSEMMCSITFNVDVSNQDVTVFLYVYNVVCHGLKYQETWNFVTTSDRTSGSNSGFQGKVTMWLFIGKTLRREIAVLQSTMCLFIGKHMPSLLLVSFSLCKSPISHHCALEGIRSSNSWKTLYS